MQPKPLFLCLSLVVLLALSGCGGNVDEAIATGIAQTQQISQLETAAAGAQASPQPTEQPSEAPSTAMPIATTRDVNLRSGDSTAYPVITVISGGETLELTGINRAGTWYQVRFRNTTGWVSADFVDGDLPQDLPVVAPSGPPPQVPTATSSSSGGGSGAPLTNYSLILDANDTDNKSISDTVSGSNIHRITITVTGLSGSDSVEVDIAFQCDTSEPEKVKLTAPGASDNVICNNNWSHQVSSSNPAVITVQLDGINSAKWTVIANVSP